MARRRKPHNRGESKSEDKSVGNEVEKGVDAPAESKTNDPAFYSRDESLLRDAGSIPFSEPFGSKIHLTAHSAAKLPDGIEIGDTLDSDRSIPGILTFSCLPSFGNAKNRLSPANVCATALYSQVRYVNNGRKNYDPADLFMYAAAITDLYGFINWCRRIYGCAFSYSQANYYVGKALLEAQNVDAEDLVSNLANFRYWINAFTNKISSYAMPAEIMLLYRRAFQFSSVYIEHEGDSIKDQFYMYCPEAFYKFKLDEDKLGMLDLQYVVQYASHTKSPEGSVFDVNEIPAWIMTTKDIIKFGEDLLENIWGDEDFGLMSGDIMRAFDGKIVKLEPLPAEFGIVPVHDKLVLTQMENSTVVPEVMNALGNVHYRFSGVGESSANRLSGCVYQDSHGNLQSYTLTYDSNTTEARANAGLPLGNVTSRFDKLINIHESSADPAVVAESLQNAVKAIPADNVDTEWDITLYDSDDEPLSGNLPERLKVNVLFTGATVVTRLTMWDYPESSSGWAQQNDSPIIRPFTISTVFGKPNTAMLAFAWDTILRAMSFKYLPKMYVLEAHSVGTLKSITALQCISPLDTYAIVDLDQVERILEVSLLSLLYVPGVAKYVNSTVAK